QNSLAERRRHRRGDGGEHLPVRDLPADPPRHSPCRPDGRRSAMITNITRRHFIASGIATGAGLTIGFRLGGEHLAAAAQSTERRFTYGELTDKAARLPVPQNPKLKSPKDFKLIGKRIARLETPQKVDGSAVYGLDVKVPGALVAVLARCPVFGGRVASFDATAAKAIPGVRHVVQIDSGVAVVA